MVMHMTRWAPPTSRRSHALLLALALASTPAAVSAQSFTELPGIEAVYGMSRDGSTLTGSRSQDNTGRAFTWTLDGGFSVFGTTPVFGTGSSGQALSDDARFVAGYRILSGTSSVFLHDRQAGTTTILGRLSGFPNNNVTGVSLDGNVVVGYGSTPFDDYRAFYWTPQGGFRAIPGLNNPSLAYGVSSDGSKIIGVQFDNADTDGFVWSQSTGARSLERLDPNWGTSANAINSSGTLIAGSATFEQNGFDTYAAVIWEDTRIARRLPLLAGYSEAQAFSLSDDGSVVVGLAYESFTQAAFVWTEATGTVTMRDYLESFGVVIPDGVSLTGKISVSADGRVFSGVDGGGFMAVVPAPSSFGLLSLAGVCGSRRRRHTVP
jgi:uncharacterized membrane protein